MSVVFFAVVVFQGLDAGYCPLNIKHINYIILSLYIYIYICIHVYTYMYTYMCIYIYICIHICMRRPKWQRQQGWTERVPRHGRQRNSTIQRLASEWCFWIPSGVDHITILHIMKHCSYCLVDSADKKPGLRHRSLTRCCRATSKGGERLASDWHSFESIGRSCSIYIERERHIYIYI